MINGLKPYPAYKDSGVQWLGKVPEHWEVRRIKRVASLNPSKSEVPLAMRDDWAVFLPMERVGSDGRIDASEVRRISDMWNGFTYFRKGDVIVAKITPCFENGKGACLQSLPTNVGFGSSEFHVIRASAAVTPCYLYRVTTLSEFRRLGAEQMMGAAGQQRVPVEFVANFLVPLPPLPEQTAIVSFLDYVDRRIRRYIRPKQRMIKLLEEYKQALIHQAVTGQIDVRTGKPYPAYKDSGVQWLGKVPEHWEVVPLKRIVLGRLKYGANAPAEFNNPLWPRYLRITDFRKNGELREDTFRSLPPDVAKEYLVYPGDILIARSGATVGKSFLVAPSTGMACYAGYLIRVRPNLARTRPEFLFAFFQSHAFAKWRLATFIVATIENISAEKYGDLLVPIPPLEEQQCIIECLKQRIAKIDAAVAAVRREIELLREYRERLIADVVTGKVDVRDVAAKLPAEPPEEEAEWIDTDEMPEGEAALDDAAEALSEEEVEP